MASHRFPLGQQVHVALVEEGPDVAAGLASSAGQPDLFARVRNVASETPTPSFLHSALCAMSLPVRRPADEHAPIIRQDGQYTLVINPKPQVDLIDGRQQFRPLGVPFGSLPRLILIHIMTEAVRSRSRHIVLGNTFSDWMRRLGYQTISYGPRGSATLIRQQLDRLLACEWMIRWDHPRANGEHEFGIREVKLTNEYVGVDRKNGGFLREIRMTEGFFEHLREHAVPLNEVAIRQIRDSATALDLYTWLAYRLPRIGGKKPALLSWQQLAVHFGNDGKNIRKFRQTVRDAWERQVSGVYPEARAEFDASVIRLHSSPAPLQQKLIAGVKLHLVTDAKGTANAIRPAPPDPAELFLAGVRAALGPVLANVWLAGAEAENVDGRPMLLVSTALRASHLRRNFETQIRLAGEAAGFTRDPEITVRAPVP